MVSAGNRTTNYTIAWIYMPTQCSFVHLTDSSWSYLLSKSFVSPRRHTETLFPLTLSVSERWATWIYVHSSNGGTVRSSLLWSLFHAPVRPADCNGQHGWARNTCCSNTRRTRKRRWQIMGVGVSSAYKSIQLPTRYQPLGFHLRTRLNSSQTK